MHNLTFTNYTVWLRHEPALCYEFCLMIPRKYLRKKIFLQASKWFNTLRKRSLALDIQGLSEEGVCAFIHSFVENKLVSVDQELECSEICPCKTLQNRAKSDRYIFSLASNPFYLWLICTIFYEAGEGYVPTTLTQLYTWVMLVFSNQWQHTEDKLSLDTETITFLKG